MCVELRRETEVINICAELRRGIGPTSEKITVVNRALPSLNGESIKNTLTIPFQGQINIKSTIYDFNKISIWF